MNQAGQRPSRCIQQQTLVKDFCQIKMNNALVLYQQTFSESLSICSHQVDTKVKND
ncbi:unnamed protein product [Paramecium sonneborni]|uniref:Uncharacterized protein n=1 Tax=Paramecium sonneborni TaxID=65129 RepID=A0A8S1RNP7_9CILI|nr:unnamed protein product [Paramecium sonneborni]